MKKRNLLYTKTTLRLCMGSLLALAMLCPNHSSCSHFKRRRINQVLLFSAAPDARIKLQNPTMYPRWADWDVRVWVPVELAPDNSLCDSVAADFSMQELSSNVFKPSNPVVVVDMPELQQLPVVFHWLFLLAFGCIGFFVAVPATTRPMRQYQSASDYNRH